MPFIKIRVSFEYVEVSKSEESTDVVRGWALVLVSRAVVPVTELMGKTEVFFSASTLIWLTYFSWCLRAQKNAFQNKIIVRGAL